MDQADSNRVFDDVLTTLIAAGLSNLDALHGAEAATKRVAGCSIKPWRDLAHESDMRALHKEQLRGDIDLDGDPDEYDPS